MSKTKKFAPNKICPHCGSDIFVLKRYCYCGYMFFKNRPKSTKKKKQIEDWKTVQRGDIIEMICDDYYETRDGDIIDMGNSGKYKVHDVKEDGLVLYNKYGFIFQNMVTEGLTISGIYVTIPRIFQIKTGTRI